MQPRKRVFEWEKTSSVPEDLDTIEDEESEKSPTIHSACYRKLRLLSTGSDDSGIGIEDADFEERDTDLESEDETDSCENGYQEDIFCIHKNLRTAFRKLQCVHTVLMES